MSQVDFDPQLKTPQFFNSTRSKPMVSLLNSLVAIHSDTSNFVVDGLMNAFLHQVFDSVVFVSVVRYDNT